MNSGFITYLIRTAKIVIPLLVGIIVVRTFIVEPSRVNGRSMESNYLDADFIIIDKYSLLFFEPRRLNVVQFYDSRNGDSAIKRVIGLPGESVTIRNNQVVITDTEGNFFMLNEPYLDTNTVTNGYPDKWKEYEVIPENHYFLMGDNREMSIDSRHFGPVPREEIRGLINQDLSEFYQ